MPPIIDLGDELLMDRDAVRTPEHRLLLDALGKPVIDGSPWLVVRKRVANYYGLFLHDEPRAVARAC